MMNLFGESPSDKDFYPILDDEVFINKNGNAEVKELKDISLVTERDFRYLIKDTVFMSEEMVEIWNKASFQGRRNMLWSLAPCYPKKKVGKVSYSVTSWQPMEIVLSQILVCARMHKGPHTFTIAKNKRSADWVTFGRKNLEVDENTTLEDLMKELGNTTTFVSLVDAKGYLGGTVLSDEPEPGSLRWEINEHLNKIREERLELAARMPHNNLTEPQLQLLLSGTSYNNKDHIDLYLVATTRQRQDLWDAWTSCWSISLRETDNEVRYECELVEIVSLLQAAEAALLLARIYGQSFKFSVTNYGDSLEWLNGKRNKQATIKPSMSMKEVVEKFS